MVQIHCPPFLFFMGNSSAIIWCIDHGHKDIVNVLIDWCSKHCNTEEIINHKLTFDSSTLLHHSAANNQPELCKFLLSNHCCPNSKDALGHTPLMEAASSGSLDRIQLLLEYVAQPNEEDKEHHTAISFCMEISNIL